MSDTTKITARFVVMRVSRWLSGASRCLLEPLAPTWREEDDDDDPVANLIFETQADVIPAQFSFTSLIRDGSVEAAEIEIPDPQHRIDEGTIIDVDIRVIGRLGAPSGEAQ